MRYSARDLALLVLRAVEEKGAYANLALRQALERYQPDKIERAFATTLTYGVLRNRGALDWALGQFLKKPLNTQTILLRNILRIGAYQLMYLDKVPPSAACNEGAEMARRYGHKGAVSFVNGVLRNLTRQRGALVFPSLEKDPLKHIAICYSHPEWLVEDWLNRLGQAVTIAICQANNQPAPLTVRTNVLKLTRAALSDRLRQEGYGARETLHAPEGLNLEDFFSLDRIPAFKEGLFQVQDESSMLAGRALSPAPGARVLDACAAPGGKTTHLAELMGNTGAILAVDPHPHKLTLIEANCRRLGVRITRTLAADASRLPDDLRAWADFVLADVPCSGLGVLRRRPDARWRLDPARLDPLVRLQRRILDGAADCLKPGGVLVYSTCTLTEQENLGQIESFLQRRREFTLEDLTPYLPAAKPLDHDNTLGAGYLQILPDAHGLDGFFIARLRKKGSYE